MVQMYKYRRAHRILARWGGGHFKDTYGHICSSSSCEVANPRSLLSVTTRSGSVHLKYDRIVHTVCPEGSDPFYIVSYYINWVTTSWTHSKSAQVYNKSVFSKNVSYQHSWNIIFIEKMLYGETHNYVNENNE